MSIIIRVHHHIFVALVSPHCTYTIFYICFDCIVDLFLFACTPLPRSFFRATFIVWPKRFLIRFGRHAVLLYLLVLLASVQSFFMRKLNAAEIHVCLLWQLQRFLIISNFLLLLLFVWREIIVCHWYLHPSISPRNFVRNSVYCLFRVWASPCLFSSFPSTQWSFTSFGVSYNFEIIPINLVIHSISRLIWIRVKFVALVTGENMVHIFKIEIQCNLSFIMSTQATYESRSGES